MAGKKSFFDAVDSRVDFPSLERELLEYWEKEGVVKKYLQKNNSSEKYFSFLDGPITANNPMGVHHGWGRTYKDLWQRFYNMRGYRQRFQNGFDCQGLWVEVEVEKELGLKDKKEIEKYGVGKFVDKCKERVLKFSAIQTDQSRRLGYFMDWDNSYFTMSDGNNYMIWNFLKRCHEEGWLYKGNDSVPWCPRCETAISQHEMLTEDYKEATHESVYMAFPILGRDGEYLLVWTTTPWTIPANVAVAVDGKIDYVLVELGNKRKYWIAEGAVKRVLKGEKYKTLKTVKGSKLAGLKYSGPFDDLPAVSRQYEENPETFHSVVETIDQILPVSVDEGTGLVHTAVSAGTEDFKLGAKLGLGMIPVIADNADYLDGLGFLAGQNAKDNPGVILDYLRNLESEGRHFVFRIENFKHRYPACWRCKTELVWKVTDEWYIAMDKGSPTLRERMKKVAKKIKWMPEFGLKRELDWLGNMHDWLISKKNRYWGLALPIWECLRCGHFTVIGSKEELKERVVEGWDKFEGKSPHKPQIDALKIKCTGCGETVSRIEPVGNPWLDAGIVPFSTISARNNEESLYKSDRKEWEKWFPADFITESFPGQFKNWFYSLIAMSTVLEDREPFKTVLGFATLLGEDGRAMHKSWGNAIEFNEGADKIGVDVMRWMYVRQNPAENLLFGYRVADETRRRFHLKLWNVYNFFVTYANLDGWSPSGKPPFKVPSSPNVLDRWILERLGLLVGRVGASLEKFNASLAGEEMEKFLDDLSLWYIRRSRERVGPAAESEKDRDDFYNSCHFVLVTLAGVLAPFVPFVSEAIYTNLTKEESVHLSPWPSLEPQETSLSGQMDLAREIAEKGHAMRKKENLAVRRPLGTLWVKMEEKPLGEEITGLIRSELNVKKVEYSKSKSLSVKLDTKITPELEEEAKTRELVRKIQAERKDMGMNLTQKIVVYSEWLPEDKKLVQWLLGKTFASKALKGNFRIEKTS